MLAKAMPAVDYPPPSAQSSKLLKQHYSKMDLVTLQYFVFKIMIIQKPTHFFYPHLYSYSFIPVHFEKHLPHHLPLESWECKIYPRMDSFCGLDLKWDPKG